MTLRIITGMPHKRAERACVSCRAAKVRCSPSTDSDAKVGGDRCARCVRFGVPCIYAPSRKVGRPKRADGENSEQDSTSVGSQKNPAPTPANSESTTSTSKTSSIDTLKTPCIDKVYRNSSTTVDIIPPLDAQSRPLSILITPDNQKGTSPYYIAIFNEYRHNVHHYIPVLPSEDTRLESTIRTATPFLMSAILSIAYPESAEEIEIPIISPTLPDLQAAALLMIVYFGQCKWQKALAISNLASKCLSSLESTFLSWERSEEAGYMGEGANTLEMWRRVWWECWVLEIFLSVVVGTPNAIVLGKEAYRPKLPYGSRGSDELTDTGDRDTLFIQAMSLLHKVLNLKGQQISLDQLTQLSNIGSNIFTIARLNWAFATSATSIPSSESALKRIVNRERLLHTALVAGGSVILLHVNAGIMVPDSETDLDPPPGSAKFLRNICREMFNILRDSVNYYSSMGSSNSGTVSGDGFYGPNSSRHPPFPPFFACTQFITAMGSFLALTRSPRLQTQASYAEMARASLVVDFHFAETVIVNRCLRWQNSRFMVTEINSLRTKMQEKITDENAKAVIGRQFTSPQIPSWLRL